MLIYGIFNELLFISLIVTFHTYFNPSLFIILIFHYYWWERIISGLDLPWIRTCSFFQVEPNQNRYITLRNIRNFFIYPTWIHPIFWLGLSDLNTQLNLSFSSRMFLGKVLHSISHMIGSNYLNYNLQITISR